MTEWRHLCLMAINITTKLTNQFTGIRPMHLTDNISSLDPDDDFRLGCGNVSHHSRQRLP